MMINKKLISLRNKNKISRSKIAREVGVSPATYTNWETGASTPKPKDLVKLSEIFGITLNDLLQVKSWNSIESPPEEWGYYLVRKKGSRQAKVAVYDTNQFLCEPIDEWTLIPK